jgi:hypothetical protein
MAQVKFNESFQGSKIDSIALIKGSVQTNDHSIERVFLLLWHL